MAKSKSRRGFESRNESSATSASASTPGSGSSVGNFFRDRGVRETIESIVIAIMLALLFRCFEAEAFIIPTGSMAVSLFGEHMDVECKQCGFQYQVGSSNEQNPENRMISVFCPMCQYNMQLNRDRLSPKFDIDHESFDGDRILANKFIYDFIDPRRWDVLIFKNPNNPKQNYIKRCIGLPNETVVIQNGDIYSFDTQTETIANKRLQRKPPDKIWHMLQPVDDTKFIADQLKQAGWPSRWNQHDDSPELRTWKIDDSGDQTSYSIDAVASELTWLRYRHIVPRWYEWDTYISSNRLPSRIENGYLGELIADYYAYNHHQQIRDAGEERRTKHQVSSSDAYITRIYDRFLGLHWVGDLCIDAELELTKNEGSIVIQLVEGGVAFNCTIDLSSGKATLSCDDSEVTFVDRDGNPTTATESTKRVIKGTGKYKIRFANYDDRLALWVNKKLIRFGDNRYLDYQRTGKVRPQWGPEKGQRGDAEPIGIAASGGAALTIHRLRVLRDIYYIASTDQRGGLAEYFRDKKYFSNETLSLMDMDFATAIRELLTSPATWGDVKSQKIFDSRNPEEDPATYQVADNSYMPMGDNSPASLDARSWTIGDERAPPYFDRQYLSGRAMIIYWPHSWNWPPFWPNFRRMGFIH